jgi:hypothetical protein
LTISDLVIEGPQQPDSTESGLTIGGLAPAEDVEAFGYCASFNYHDPLGLVGLDTMVRVVEKYSPSGTILSDDISFEHLVNAGVEWTGDGFSGSLSEACFSVFYGVFEIAQAADTSGDDSVKVTFTIKTADGRASNSLSQVLPRPDSPS